MRSEPVYRSAEALGIQEWEREGLIALVGPLSRGELALDMHCGTAACIGGYVALRAEAPHARSIYGYAAPAVDGSEALHSLFYPKDWHLAWECSAPQAARAVVNFLVTVLSG